MVVGDGISEGVTSRLRMLLKVRKTCPGGRGIKESSKYPEVAKQRLWCVLENIIRLVWLELS